MSSHDSSHLLGLGFFSWLPYLVYRQARSRHRLGGARSEHKSSSSYRTVYVFHINIQVPQSHVRPSHSLHFLVTKSDRPFIHLCLEKRGETKHV